MSLLTDFAIAYDKIADLPLSQKKRLIFKILEKDHGKELRPLLELKKLVDSLLVEYAAEDGCEDKIRQLAKDLQHLAAEAQGVVATSLNLKINSNS